MNMISRTQLYTDQTSSRWKNANKMKHFTIIADLNAAQKYIFRMVTYLFFYLFYSSICQLYNCQKLWFCNGILAIYFRLKTTIFNVKS